MQAFSTWWEACEETRAANGKMYKVLQRLRSVTLSAALAKWRSHSGWARHLLHSELQARVHWESSICRGALRRWVALVRQRSRNHLAAFMKTAVLRIQHGDLAAAFGGWRDNVWELRRQQRIRSRAVARMHRRTLAASFLHLRGVVRQRQRGRRIVEAFRARSRRGSLALVRDTVNSAQQITV